MCFLSLSTEITAKNIVLHFRRSYTISPRDFAEQNQLNKPGQLGERKEDNSSAAAGRQLQPGAGPADRTELIQQTNKLDA